LVQPIGKTVVGGLTVATLLTLFLIPVLYYAFNRLSDKRTAKRQEKQRRRHERELEVMKGKEGESA
ncbi:MAG: hypothetical protein ACOC25_09295, partial [Alkalispirochaetaceae bacterium]